MTTCYHCGQTNALDDERWQLREEPRDGQRNAMNLKTSPGLGVLSFCCPACMAVYQCIRDGGFDAYYQQRTEFAQKPEEEAEARDYSELDSLLNDLPFVTAINETQTARAQLLLSGVHCSACAWLVESVVQQLPGIEDVQVNLRQSKITVSWRTSVQKLSVIMKAVHALGYVPSPWTSEAHTKLHTQEKALLQRRLGIAGLLMMQVGMLSLGLYAGEFQGMEQGTKDLLRLTSLLLSTVSIFYCAHPFFLGASKALRKLRLTMDVPIALALGTAYLASLQGTVSGADLVYFDTVCMFVFFLLLSRYIEISSRSPDTFTERDNVPLTADRRRSANNQSFGDAFEIETVLSKQLIIGDTVLCRAGEAVCADGIITEGKSHFDEATFTGEHLPVRKSAGDQVLAGSLNLGEQIWIEVTRPLNESSVVQISKLVNEADEVKPVYAQLIDRISPWFIAAVILLALLSVLYWLQSNPAMALQAGLAVLIVSCPCALALATPLALASAHKAARGFAVVPATKRFLQVMPKVTDIVFDKTGTLTSGHLSLEIECAANVDSNQMWQLAASLELASSHPLAAAFRLSYQGSYLATEDFKEVIGCGVEARIDGTLYRLGKPDWSSEICPVISTLKYRNDGKSNSLADVASDVMLCNDKKVLATFAVHEELRPDTQESTAILSDRGYQLHLLSGDAKHKVDLVANKLAIEKSVSAASPSQKLDYIRRLQADGKQVLMVGDGVNDAPVLASANVSIAMNGAADISKCSADAVLLTDCVGAVPNTLELAARANQTVVQNIAWAIAYNALSLPLAAVGVLPPWAAAIGMSASSLIVIVNSMRLVSNRKTTAVRQNMEGKMQSRISPNAGSSGSDYLPVPGN